MTPHTALMALWLCCAAALSPAADCPSRSWERLSDAEAAAAGWSREVLAQARAYAGTLNTEAVMIVTQGKILDTWGECDRKFNVHSIRKSLLSALCGIQVQAGKLRLDHSLAELGIDDNPPSLTEVEKQATVRQLLQARSGVYHPALYETERMKALRPQRHSHAPGEFWYYNNWDFNALGTIYEQATRASIYEDFARYIAAPLGMEDYLPADGAYVTGEDSVHRAYPFRMTARDMARFGLLYLRGGRWNGKQVIPEAWIEESLRLYSDARTSGGYGYLWWIARGGMHLPHVTLPEGSYSARGARGHYILVVPALDLVLVHRVNTDTKNPSQNDSSHVGRPDKTELPTGLGTGSKNLSQNGSSHVGRPDKTELPTGSGTGPKERRVEATEFGELVRRILLAYEPSADDRLAQALDTLVPLLMSRHQVPGVGLVGIDKGRIAWEKYFGVREAGKDSLVDENTVFEAASMSKPLAAYAALKLVEQGRLDLDRPLCSYLSEPYLRDEPLHQKITARMVLSHTSGFPNWRRDQPLRVLHEPGTRYLYSGEGFVFLQRVIEGLAGEDYESYMQRTLLQPLSMTSSSFQWQDAYAEVGAAGHDNDGTVKTGRSLYTRPNAAFSLYCTPRDYAAFVLEMMNPDRGASHSISADSLRWMLTPLSPPTEKEPLTRRYSKGVENVRFGLGWAVETTASGVRIRHSGVNGTGFRSHCEFDPVQGHGLIIMTNGSSGEKFWHDLVRRIGIP